MSPMTQNGPKSQDQLEAILNVLGHQDQADLSFITDPDVAEQLAKYNQNSEKLNFKKSFPLSNEGLTIIL